MSIEYWDDFNNKYGFSDGDQVPPDAFAVREAAVRVLNHFAEGRGSTVRYAVYDRGGFHNCCMVWCLEAEKLVGIDPLDGNKTFPIINAQFTEDPIDEAMRTVIDDIDSEILPDPYQFVKTVVTVERTLLEDALVNFVDEFEPEEDETNA